LENKWIGVLIAITILLGITAIMQLGLNIPEDILTAILLIVLWVLGVLK